MSNIAPSASAVSNMNTQQQQQQQQQFSNASIASIELNHHTFQTWIDILVDVNSNEEIKLKAVQDLSLHLEIMQTLPTYAQLIEDSMRKFIRFLSDTEPQFTNESQLQQIRKKILEIIQRTAPIFSPPTIGPGSAVAALLSSNTQSIDQRLILSKELLYFMYGLLEKENEENVIICLKIITDYHRHLKMNLSNNEVNYIII
jgi:transformation/transcription domain-associated protein